MDNVVKLVFRSIAQGSGLEKASQDTEALRKNLNMASGAVGALSQGFGDLGHLFGGALSGILTGNFWQIGATACNFLIGKIKEHNKLMKDAALAAKGLSSEYFTLEYAHKGYLNSLEKWKKAKEEADSAEQKAAEAAKKALEDEKNAESARLSFEQKYYALEQQISDEIKKRETLNADELTQLKAKIEAMKAAAKLDVRNAEGNLAYANQHGTGYDKDTASQELRLARERQKTAEEEANKLMADFEKREKEKADKRKKDEEDFAEFVRQQREKLDREIEARQAKDRQRELEAEKEKNRQQADDLERKLSDAMQRAEDARDVLGNAAGMDQGGELAGKRQRAITDSRFAARAKSLQARLDEAGGDVTKLGRLSNLDRAVYDRMIAEKERDGAKDQLKRLNDSFDKLAQKLEEHDQL